MKLWTKLLLVIPLAFFIGLILSILLDFYFLKWGLNELLNTHKIDIGLLFVVTAIIIFLIPLIIFSYFAYVSRRTDVKTRYLTGVVLSLMYGVCVFLVATGITPLITGKFDAAIGLLPAGVALILSPIIVIASITCLLKNRVNE